MKKNNIEIIPYTEVDGIRTYKDSFIMELHDRIIEDGYGYMFDDGGLKTREKFLYIMKYENNILYVLYIDKEIAGVVWLSDFDGKTAKIHWCAYAWVSIRQKIRILTYAADQFLKIKEKNGSYLFDLLLGVTPASNKQAVKFAKAGGGKLLGKVPHIVWNERKGISESGYVSYYHRGMEDEGL